MRMGLGAVVGAPMCPSITPPYKSESWDPFTEVYLWRWVQASKWPAYAFQVYLVEQKGGCGRPTSGARPQAEGGKKGWGWHPTFVPP